MFKSNLRYLYVLILAVYSYLNIKFTEGDQLLGDQIAEIYLIGLIGVLVLLIWESNRFLFQLFKINSRSTPQYLLTAFMLSLIAVMLLSGLSAVFSITVGMPTFLGAFKLSLAFVFRVNLFLHCINAIVFYQQQLRASELNEEKAKKENVLASYNALKRQISPHFLFNSLNVLDELINQDKKQASEFLSRLSQVYRYITRNQSNDLVSLEEEIAFIRSYIYLLETRFKDHLTVRLSVKEEDFQKQVLPVALQILLENVVKHNEISSSKNLNVAIESDHHYLIVTNDIQPKVTPQDNSLGIGLENIKKRYEFFTGRDVIVLNDGTTFEVKLPLLTSEK